MSNRMDLESTIELFEPGDEVYLRTTVASEPYLTRAAGAVKVPLRIGTKWIGSFAPDQLISCYQVGATGVIDLEAQEARYRSLSAQEGRGVQDLMGPSATPPDPATGYWKTVSSDDFDESVSAYARETFTPEGSIYEVWTTWPPKGTRAVARDNTGAEYLILAGEGKWTSMDPRWAPLSFSDTKHLTITLLKECDTIRA